MTTAAPATRASNARRLLGSFVRPMLPILVAGVLQQRRMPLVAALVASLALASLAGRLRRRLEIGWTEPSGAVYVGDTVQLPFWVANTSRGATGSLVLHLGGEGIGPATLALPALSPGERGGAVAHLPMLRRRAAGPLARQLLVHNRLVGRVRTVAVAKETLFPAVRPIPDLPPAQLLRRPSALAHEGMATGRRGDADPLLVRGFVSGDPISSVHWRSTARLGSPVVIEREDVGTGRVVLLVAGTPAQYEGVPTAGDQAFERAVARAAGLVQAAYLAAVPVSVVAGAGAADLPDPSAHDAVQDWLAGLGRTGQPEPALLDSAIGRAAGGVVAVLSQEPWLAPEVRRLAASTRVLDLAEPW